RALIRGVCAVTLSAPVLSSAPAGAATRDSVDADVLGRTERELADVLAGVLDIQTGPLDGHFLDGLGANSLVMAQLCARARKRPDLPSPSMRDIYASPTIHSLATALPAAVAPATVPQPTPGASAPTGSATGAARDGSDPAPAPTPRRAGAASYLL